MFWCLGCDDPIQAGFEYDPLCRNRIRSDAEWPPWLLDAINGTGSLLVGRCEIAGKASVSGTLTVKPEPLEIFVFDPVSGQDTLA